MLKNYKKVFSILLVIILTFVLIAPQSYASTSTPTYCIIVNTQTNKLGYYKNGKLVKEFKVATGKSSSLTPTGKTKIVNKIKNRPYYSGGIPGGDPRNPLGDRWLGLNLRGTYGTTYAIHGNNDLSSIGKHVSEGCVRMYNNEVRWLFDRVPVGTTVILDRSSKSFVQIAKKYNITLQSSSSNDFKKLTTDIYRYDAGKGKYLTYINGRGYSQYLYLNASGNYAFTPSSWMTAAGLTVSKPSSSNGYKMTVNNPYIKMSSDLNEVLNKAKAGNLTKEEIQNELNKVTKISYSDNTEVSRPTYKKNLTKDIYRYDAGKGKYLTTINGRSYSQYSYLNKSGTYAFTPSSWMSAAGVKVTMPSASNGYIMQINNTYVKKYNDIIKELKSYL